LSHSTTSHFKLTKSKVLWQHLLFKLKHQFYFQCVLVMSCVIKFVCYTAVNNVTRAHLSIVHVFASNTVCLTWPHIGSLRLWSYTVCVCKICFLIHTDTSVSNLHIST